MLTVHRAQQASTLADVLAGLLETPLADPFAPEVVAVPARGVERWLAQRLSTRLGGEGGTDGVCAGVLFPSPATLVADALAAADGVPAGDDPWGRAVWPVLEVLDGSRDEPWCALLAAHLGSPGDEIRAGRRYATAAHLAGLFRRYATDRPHMLRDWAAGRDTDGSAGLAADLTWQAELYRRLRTRIGPGPAERLPQACAVLRAAPALSALPGRLSLFGPTRLATDALAVLDALAAHRDVHLWLPHPSAGMWERLRDVPAGRRRDDTGATVPRHPLLRSLARDTRELQVRLPPHTDALHEPVGLGGTGVGRPGPGGTGSLLARLQQDLQADRAPVPVGDAGDPSDGSVQVHACHGPTRQVEVLRDVLLGLLQDDPALEPRDVLVLCPDVETFAPLVSAAFGLTDGPSGRTEGGSHPGSVLRVRLADRSLRRTNPLLDTVAALLELAASRVTAGAVLDLAATGPVRRQFGFDDEELERLRDWVAGSGVRWGLDAPGRAPYGLSALPQNTWASGLDRLLLGVTTAEDEPVWLGQALPLDDVDSSDVDLAGRLTELVDRLAAVLHRLQGRQPAACWAAALVDGLVSLTSTGDADAWQLGQVRAELADAVHGAGSDLRLPDVRALLADRLRGRPTRANFRTGSLTVCTMVPMRSVPHRVVVLLGLDDGVFPRVSGVDGDDVLARDAWVGERDARSEDRQLFLDALLAAGERLVVLHTGADPVSGVRRPAAVPVGELLDVLDAMAPGAAEAVVVRHPLQPHDPRNFRPSSPFSFDPVHLAGARRALEPRKAPRRAGPLPRRTDPVALADLVAFVQHPGRAYLQHRLGISLPFEGDEVDDELPVALTALQEWAVSERLLEAALAGAEPAGRRHREWLRGTLPPGPLGARLLDVLEARVAPVVAAAVPLLVAPAQTVEITLTIAGRALRGTVTGVRDGAAVAVSSSALSARHRARAWVHALVLGAEGHGDRAVAVGRRRGGARTVAVRAPERPDEALADLLELYERGMCEPLPLFAKTSAAYAADRLDGASVEQALESAQRPWRAKHGGERDDAAHTYLWGAGAELAALLDAAPGDGESWPGETTRFGALACRLWAPLRDAEAGS